MGSSGSQGEAAPPAAEIRQSAVIEKPKTKSMQAEVKPEVKTRMVMGGRYEMYMDKESLMGQGSSSLCRKGMDTQTKQYVAIKVYKSQKQGAVTLEKFKRQIAVLNELLEPFDKSCDAKYWHSRMDTMDPKDIFMELLDWSKGPDGEPGPDSKDGRMYVVTELAEYSLKDYLSLCRSQRHKPSKEKVWNVARAILDMMSGLHAKGLVHLDFKPENMMMFDGNLKLIDVDGCVKVGKPISITDSSISFSPCYCSPEWAKFLITESTPTMIADQALDVWSVGMTIAELVNLDAVLKPMYASFLQNSNRSHQEAGFLFMEWLSECDVAPTPKNLGQFDKELEDLVVNHLCCPDKNVRKTCAQCLDHPFFKRESPQVEVKPRSKSEMQRLSVFLLEDGGLDVKLQNLHKTRHRLEDEEDAIIHKSTLFKLNTGANPTDAAAWLQRDMWITPNGNICYWSQKDSKKLILIPANALHNAAVKDVAEAARPFALEVEVDKEDASGEFSGKQSYFFAASSSEDKEKWMDLIHRAAEMDLVTTFHLGAKMADDLQKFKIAVMNRRMKVGDGDAFEGIFKSKLWKLKGEGDPKVPEHWFLRDFQIAKNGSLTYWSAREERQLVYYTSEDVSGSSIATREEDGLAKPFVFTITLPPSKGVEFEPGCFSAENEEQYQAWLDQLAKTGATFLSKGA